MGTGKLCGCVTCLDLAMPGFDVAFFVKGLHSASIPGILALDLCPSDTNKILTGESGPGPAGWTWEQQQEKMRDPGPAHGSGDRSSFLDQGI